MAQLGSNTSGHLFDTSFTTNGALYSAANGVLTSTASANSAVLVTNSSGVPVYSGTMTNGQLIIGNTSGTPTAATLTGGTGISIVNSAGGVTINSTGGLTWTDQSGTFNAASNNGYFITNTSTPTLPAAPNVGDEISFFLDAAATVTITGNTGQVIRVDGNVSASAGTAVSSTRGNVLTLVYRSTNTQWCATEIVGNWVIT